MRNQRKREDRILLIAGIVFLCIFCVSGFLLLNYYFESRKQADLNEQLAQLKHGKQDEFIIVEAIPITPDNTVQKDEAVEEETGSASVSEEQETTESSDTEVTSLSELNPDYVGWIQMEDTPIDYPVVYRDNSYYLRRDFYGEKNRHGTIFLDECCDTEDTFLLLHGHNMKDGTMFGCLKNLKKKDYREEHTQLTLSWEQEEETFEIFAGALIDLYDENRFRYELLPQVKETAEEYLEQLKEVAFWYEDISWEEGDRVVVLSTCDYGTEEQRLIIVAVEKN